MNQEMEERLTSYVRILANYCKSCLHKSEENCASCPSNMANKLLAEIELQARPTPQIDYSYYAREKEIKRILSESDKPLLAREIDLKHTCSSALKFWTLNCMIQKKILGRRFAFKSKSKKREKVFFYYFLRKGKNEK